MVIPCYSIFMLDFSWSPASMLWWAIPPAWSPWPSTL